MLKLVVIDLSAADIALFEEYERKTIARLSSYGAKVASAVRSIDGMTETHILYFPDESSFEKFLADPVRVALQENWKQVIATSTVTTVANIDYL